MPQTIADPRQLLTGKDGRLYVTVNGISVFLAEVDTFNVQMNVSNTDYQPVGSILTYAVNTGVSFSLTFTEAVIRDDITLKPVIESIRQGIMPVYDFQGALERYDGQEERITFRNATPDGTFDVMNLTPGEIIKRASSFRLNSVPEFIKTLTSSTI